MEQPPVVPRHRWKRGLSRQDSRTIPNAGPKPEAWRRLILALALLVPAVFVVLAALALRDARDPVAPTVGSVSVSDRLDQATVGGERAPSFRLPRLEGVGTIGLGDFARKVVVLNLWASWCEPCREEAPHLLAVWQQYRARGVQFLGVNHQDRRAPALAFQREFGINYPSAFDPEGTVAARYRLVGIPSTLVIDRGGGIAYRFLGKVDASTLRAALDRVIEEAAA